MNDDYISNFPHFYDRFEYDDLYFPKRTQEPINLNKLFPVDEDDYGIEKKFDQSITSENISVYFRNLEKHLIKHIQESDAVFGAVAWLTNFNILEALRDKEVALVIQKEDFLRPDINNEYSAKWKEKLRIAYANLGSNYLGMYYFEDNIMSRLSYGSEEATYGWAESIRCAGNYNNNRNQTKPKMHNKFLVFAKLKKKFIDEDYDEYNFKIEPYAVWTGSFNFTQNANFSLENAIYIKDKDITLAYYKEFGQIAAISEPLNWKYDWATPQWRIGS
jgi:hypothetical protein